MRLLFIRWEMTQFGLRAELEWSDSAISGELKYSLGGVIRFE
jgi:hypothetical protein